MQAGRSSLYCRAVGKQPQPGRSRGTIQLLRCSTICGRGQIITGQTSGLRCASSCEDNAGRHDVMRVQLWQERRAAVLERRRQPWGFLFLFCFVFSSTQPSLSIYTHLGANTLSLYLFPILANHCASRFVSHWGHSWKPAPTHRYTSYIHMNVPGTALCCLFVTSRCCEWTRGFDLAYSDHLTHGVRFGMPDNCYRYSALKLAS